MLTSRVVQAYIAVQIFVERCLMNMEAPTVVVNLETDDTWSQWEWMSRYRIWEANREVFLYPENWLIESQRPNRTETYQTFEQEVRQGQSTTDYLETVVLNYIDRLDGLAHLHVTGTCSDTSGTSTSSPAHWLIRPSFVSAPTPMARGSAGKRFRSTSKLIRLFRYVYRGRMCLFWMDIKVSKSRIRTFRACRQQAIHPARRSNDTLLSASTSPSIAMAVGRRRNRPRAASSTSHCSVRSLFHNSRAVEALYTLKVQPAPVTPGFGASIWLDVFRYGDYDARIVALAEQAQIAAAGFIQAESNASGVILDLDEALAGFYLATRPDTKPKL